MVDKIQEINGIINGFIWGPIMCAIFVLIGIYFSVGTGMFQITRFKIWWNATIKAIFIKGEAKTSNDKKAISQFQALTTSLAATVGTGNIVGVSTALVSGGPGAVFWMWVSALFGMMTKYAEIVLSMKYRSKNEKGQWIGGAMVTIERRLNNKPLAALFAFFCLVASFGIGNMSQANSMAGALQSTIDINPLYLGIMAAGFTGLVIIGGIKRIGSITEKVVPFMAIIYILGCTIIILMNFRNIPWAFMQIFEGAFGIGPVSGGLMGYTVSQAMRFGVTRGVFSNEAGLGSSAIVHCATNSTNPVQQGFWGICEVFIDTIVICTMTALAVLTTGVLGSVDGNGELITGAALTIKSFSSVFGEYAGLFVSFGIVTFAFSTLIGWSYYGERALEYLVGYKYTTIYKVLFIAAIVVGCTMSLDLAWSLSDTFNGLMAIPNLICLVLLSGEVFHLTKEYVNKNKVK